MQLSPFFIKRFGVCLVLFLLSCLAVSATTYYVPANYSTIQAAIDAAVNGDTIIVSPGTYVENINFRGKNIILTSTDSNNPNVTVIDGNAVGRVVRFSGGETSACVLCGFTITGGSAVGSEVDGCGGGVFGDGTQATIFNCIIRNNRANYGGGLCDCHGMISNCRIIGNTAANVGGGLWACDGGITNCTIIGNQAYDGGGISGGNGRITNCTIVGNHADDDGGGMYVCGPVVTNCILWGNSARDTGDQIFLGYNRLPTYSCIQGWGVSWAGNIDSDPLFADISSTDPNEWDLHLLTGSPCIDAGTNTPDEGLPATDIEGTARPLDGDFDGNPVAEMGAYEYSIQTGIPYLYVTPTNFNFTAEAAGGSLPDQILTIYSDTLCPINWTIDTSEKPGWLTVLPTSGLVDPNESESVTLSVDTTGLSNGLHSYTFEVVDPAALNSPQTITVYLGIGGVYVPSSNYPTIQDAIDTVMDGDTIVVLPGTYTIYEDIYFNGKNIVLTSADPNDPDIVADTVIDGGGTRQIVFDGTETSACVLRGFTITHCNGPKGGGICGGFFDQGCESTISNCVITQNTAGKGGGLYHCDGAIVNCTITGNMAPGGRCGGLYDCDGTITDCTITGNTGISGALDECAGTISNCTISGNDGGGLTYCDGTITDCTIRHNVGYPYGSSGRGLYDCDGTISNCSIINNCLQGLAYCDGTITNCTIKDNIGSVYGCGVVYCNAKIVNSLIIDNVGGSGRGLAFCGGQIINCTIAGNGGTSDWTASGGGLYEYHGSIVNCIVWGNFYYSLENCSVPSYSCIENWGGGGTGNISSDPLYADAEAGDYHLKSEGWRWDASGEQWTWDDETSPCIDAGNPGMALGDEPITLDVDPLNRWGENIRINMGAYGGTPEASMPPPGWALLCDLDNSGDVNLSDFAPLATAWMETAENQPPDVSRDGTVDLGDLVLFTDDWLNN